MAVCAFAFSTVTIPWGLVLVSRCSMAVYAFAFSRIEQPIQEQRSSVNSQGGVNSQGRVVDSSQCSDILVAMSDFSVPVLEYAAESHPNADALEMAVIGGWRAGLLSQGIVYGGDRISALSVGDDAAETLGLVKWMPPVPVHMSGLMEPGPKIGYDIDDVKSWPGRMIEGEDAVVTEKLHGSFCCLGLRRGEPGPGLNRWCRPRAS